MKTLQNLKKSDFTKNNNKQVVLIDKAEIIIEYDFYNDKWIYSSNDISCSGDYYGSITEFKKYLKDEVIKCIGDHLKKYTGYGYHGGGRKATGVKRVSICISGQPDELEQLKKNAESAGKTVSKFVLDALVKNYKHTEQTREISPAEEKDFESEINLALSEDDE
ncbi:MAG: hypothetical protein MJ162_00975 [Treponema sp.]|nr:hypothetical protein [Treponema sp.]